MGDGTSACVSPSQLNRGRTPRNAREGDRCRILSRHVAGLRLQPTSFRALRIKFMSVSAIFHLAINRFPSQAVLPAYHTRFLVAHDAFALCSEDDGSIVFFSLVGAPRLRVTMTSTSPLERPTVPTA